LVLLDLVLQRRPGADQAHVPAEDVPELRKLVEGDPAEDAAGTGDPRIALVHGPAGAPGLRADDHRSQLQQLELDRALAYAPLTVQHRPSAFELDRQRRER